MSELFRPKKRKMRHGFLGMLEASKPAPIADAEQQSLPTDPHLAQAMRMVKIAKDAKRGWPELKRRNPELYEKITREQHEVAEKRRRAGSNPDILDMRLD